jgi:hypothetical protein
MALVQPETDIAPQSGLPGGQNFVCQDWQSTYRWITSTSPHAEAAALGSVHSGGRQETVWRRGVVVSFLPRVVGGLTYFCAIDDKGGSQAGDSGGLWLGNQDGQKIALGIHVGIMPGTGLALATDIASAIPIMGLTELLG